MLGAQERAEDLPTEQLVALSVRHDAGHFGAQLARCVGKVCRPSVHERSLASTLHKRDSRAKIPDLSGMVVGGKLQVQKTTDTNITV